MNPDALTTLTLTNKERAAIADCIHFAMRFADAIDAPDEHLLGMQFLKTQVLGDLDYETTGRIV